MNKLRDVFGFIRYDLDPVNCSVWGLIALLTVAFWTIMAAFVSLLWRLFT